MLLIRLTALMALVFLVPVNSAMAAQKPNVVILFADDLGYADLASYGNPYIRTPSLDALAREGQRWTDFYVSAPVCSPSRGSLLTGQVPVRSGLYGRRIGVMFPGDSQGIPASRQTLANALKAEGYATGIFGKWHLGDASDQLPTHHGFDYWFGIPYSNDMNRVGQMDITDAFRLRAQGRGEEVTANFAVSYEYYENPRIEYYDIPLWRSERTASGVSTTLVERPLQQDTFTRRLTDETIRFIEEHRDEPFLAYVPYTTPHLPLFASREFSGQSLRGTYGDVVEELDWSVGRIRASLERLGLADNTIVLFTSDNGPWQAASVRNAGSAGVLRGAKGSTWEGGVRVPAIFWWPGAIEPAVVSHIGSTLDLYDTFLALAGVEGSNQTDGVDLSRALLEGEDSPRHEMPYWKMGELRAYRRDNWKLSWYEGDDTTTRRAAPALYDLSNDLAEVQDLAASYPGIVAELQAAAARHVASLQIEAPIFDARLSVSDDCAAAICQ